MRQVKRHREQSEVEYKKNQYVDFELYEVAIEAYEF